VILHLNGAFGVGKTTVARLLVRRLPHASLYDPELVGTLVRALGRNHDDYQDDPVWRRLVVAVAGVLHAEVSMRLVVPMTLWRPEYHAEIVGGLRAVDSDVRLFRLAVSEDVLRARIHARPDADGPHEWCLRHVASGVAAMRDERFGREIRTDGRTPDEIADEIAALVAPR
jgi:AAA domain